MSIPNFNPSQVGFSNIQLAPQTPLKKRRNPLEMLEERNKKLSNPKKVRGIPSPGIVEKAKKILEESHSKRTNPQDFVNSESYFSKDIPPSLQTVYFLPFPDTQIEKFTKEMYPTSTNNAQKNQIITSPVESSPLQNMIEQPQVIEDSWDDSNPTDPLTNAFLITTQEEELNPNREPVKSETIAHSYFSSGNLKWMEGNLNEAILHYKHGLLYAPSNSEIEKQIYKSLGFILLSMGNYQLEALEALEKSLDEASPDPSSVLNLGLGYFQLWKQTAEIISLDFQEQTEESKASHFESAKRYLSAYLDSILALQDPLNDPQKQELQSIYKALGELFLSESHYALSLDYLNRGMALLKELECTLSIQDNDSLQSFQSLIETAQSHLDFSILKLLDSD